MRYIKVKVKTLLLILLIIISIGGGSYYLRDNILYKIGEVYELKGDTDIAGTYYKKVAENFPNKRSAVKAATKQIKGILDNNDLNYSSNVIISGNFSMKNGASISYKSLENINRDFKEISKYNDENDEFAEYTVGVAIMNWFGGEYKKGISLLENIDYIEEENLEEIRKLNLATMYINIGEIEKGRNIIENDTPKNDIYKYIRNDVFAYSSLLLQDYKEFSKNTLDNYSLRYESKKQINNPYMNPFDSVKDFLEHFDYFLKYKETLSTTNNTIEGKITIDGKPLKYAFVFTKENKHTGSSSIFPDPGLGEKALGVTDKDGYFRMENIPNGLYGICIAVDWNRVKDSEMDIRKSFDIELDGNDIVYEEIKLFKPMNIEAKALDTNKIEFNWESSRADIDHYVIQLGEIRETENKSEIVNFNYISDEIKGNSYILDIEKARDNFIQSGMGWDRNGLHPYYVLEPLYHKGYYAYKITGYNNNGEIVLDNLGLFSNKPYKSVYIEGNEWTKADKLLIDKKYEDAVYEYEKAFKENPNDIHSIKALAKLYYYGWMPRESGYYKEGRDLKKAEKYFDILNRKYKNNRSIMSTLADIYKLNKQYDKALELYNELVKDNDGRYSYNSIADIYVYKKDFDKAEESYKLFYEKTKRDGGLTDLMMIYVLQNRSEDLLEISKKFNNDFYYAEYERLIKEYIRTNKNDYKEFYELINSKQFDSANKYLENKNDDLGNLYRGILLLQQNINRDEKEKAYTEIYDTVNDKTIKELMLYFGKGGLNTGFGERRYEEMGIIEENEEDEKNDNN